MQKKSSEVYRECKDSITTPVPSYQPEHQPGYSMEYEHQKKKSIFYKCCTKKEKRDVATLIINKALQGGKNKTYCEARRKMTKWIELQGICKEDEQVMVWYIGELFNAGAKYIRGVEHVAGLVKDLREELFEDVSHLSNTDGEWVGFFGLGLQPTLQKYWEDHQEKRNGVVKA